MRESVKYKYARGANVVWAAMAVFYETRISRRRSGLVVPGWRGQGGQQALVAMSCRPTRTKLVVT